MFCKKCGNKIEEGHKFCTKCGNDITLNTNNNSDDGKANKLCLISLLMLLSPMLISTLYKLFISIIPLKVVNTSINSYSISLIGLVLMVYIRVKYPQNKFGKILMWLYIIAIMLSLIFLVMFVVACHNCVRSFK